MPCRAPANGCGAREGEMMSETAASSNTSAGTYPTIGEGGSETRERAREEISIGSVEEHRVHLTRSERREEAQ